MSAATATGDDIDPLDAYMASLTGEITQQAPDITTPSPPSSRSTSSHRRRQQPPPSTAQLAIANKVSASPFCDVLNNTAASRGARDRPGHRMGSGVADSDAAGSSDQHNGAATADGEATEACLRLLLDQPAEFLR